MKENMHVVLMRIVCENLENSLYLWNKKQLLMSKLSFNLWSTAELAHSFWILDNGSICASFQGIMYILDKDILLIKLCLVVWAVSIKNISR